MKTGLIVIVVLVLIALVAFGQYVGVRNTLVTKNEAVKASWSQVDIVLQRRADLIPNLVETVKGYAKQEQTVFGDIAKARSALLSAGSPQEKIAANNHRAVIAGKHTAQHIEIGWVKRAAGIAIGPCAVGCYFDGSAERGVGAGNRGRGLCGDIGSSAGRSVAGKSNAGVRPIESERAASTVDAAALVIG